MVHILYRANREIPTRKPVAASFNICIVIDYIVASSAGVNIDQ
jgi:hypothetical protein